MRTLACQVIMEREHCIRFSISPSGVRKDVGNHGAHVGNPKLPARCSGWLLRWLEDVSRL